MNILWVVGTQLLGSRIRANLELSRSGKMTHPHVGVYVIEFDG